MSTRAERDAKNAAELEAALECGSPSMLIKAINSSKAAAEADEDEIRLMNDLILCIGARVMIVQNLCVAHGLVNGTTGRHDIPTSGDSAGTEHVNAHAVRGHVYF